MEFHIDDLLDELQEVPVDILPYTAASESRIKELTMKKISNYPRRRHTGRGITRKILIAAAIIAALAVPVLAASGILFSDWTPGIEQDQGNHFDNSPVYGAGSMVWEASNWSVRISAEKATSTGLMLVCEELGSPDKSGSLVASDGFWLEQWDGNVYVPMTGSVTADSSTLITAGSVIARQVSWDSIYGTLPHGSYRLGQNFTFTNTGGETRELTFYAKFRIFTSEMEPYLKKQEAALDSLKQQNSFHLILKTCNTAAISVIEHDYYIEEIWKNSNDFLMQVRYYGPDGLLYPPKGYLFRDGMGYALEWASADTDADTLFWEAADYVDQDYLEGWDTMYTIIESTLVEIYDGGNTISYVEFFDSLSPEDLDIPEEDISPYINHDYTERIFTFDNSGNLKRIENFIRTSMDQETADIVLSRTLEVVDTTAEEISRIIASPDLSSIPAFSWAEDETFYAACAYVDGFNSKEALDSPSVSRIISLARAELDPKRDKDFREGSEYNVVNVYRDESKDMWKLVFQFSQSDEVTQIVFINGNGQTIMIAVP